MVAATENNDGKKKRGRPPVMPDEIYDLLCPDEERRTAQNRQYAFECIRLFDGTEKDFFVTPKGNFRRQGIAEKIGRMIARNLLTEEEARKLALRCMREYENGEPVKAIEKRLARLRNSLIYQLAEDVRKGGEEDEKKNPKA